VSASAVDERNRQILAVLRKYRLPTGGEYPFLPPKGWHPTMPLWPGGDRGFVDLNGNLWKRGRSITPGEAFEWDVQLGGAGHLNVDLGGNVSHGQGKEVGKKSRSRSGKTRGRGKKK
jgi:hypothetical protein